jgi:hypothetical protein
MDLAASPSACPEKPKLTLHLVDLLGPLGRQRSIAGQQLLGSVGFGGEWA